MADQYYQQFDAATHNGRVHQVEIYSGRRLDPVILSRDEKRERQEWASTREDLYTYYDEAPPRERGRTREDVLCERIAPPNLADVGQSVRYHGGANRNPKYPRQLHHWQNLKTLVASHLGDTAPNTLIRRHGNLFLKSLAFELRAREEAGEQTFLENCVFDPLATAGILPPLNSRPGNPAHGVIDFNIADTERVRVVVETKSTHSLPLPNRAVDVIARFSNGRTAEELTTERDQSERRLDKLYVCDTIGQLLRYMLLNGCRYGALTSGSRTYFVCIVDDSNGNRAEDVFISDAWFVGEHDYLRAWAYIYDLARYEAAFFPSIGEDPGQISWEGSDDEYHPEDRGGADRQGNDEARVTRRSQGRAARGGDDGGGGGAGGGCATEAAIEHVHFQDIAFDGVLGYGRNGCVMRATWKGEPVAVKQFDCAREGVYQRFVNEINAYSMLEEVQGLYVPKAFFVSEIPGFEMRYLGLQLGRDPSPQDVSRRWEVYDVLRDKYGIKHGDFVYRNTGVIIAGTDGKDHLALIDWEEYELCDPLKVRRTNNGSVFNKVEIQT